MKRLLIGAALSGVAAMIWGFVFFAAGPAELGFEHLSVGGQEAVLETLGREIPRTGTYVLPDPGQAMDGDWAARHLAGPLVFLHITQAGADPMSPRIYILGFFHMLLTALLMGLLLQHASLETYKARLGLAVLVGVVVVFWSHMSGPIWFYQPWGYHLVTAVYDLVAIGIMGTIMARFSADSTT